MPPHAWPSSRVARYDLLTLLSAETAATRVRARSARRLPGISGELAASARAQA